MRKIGDRRRLELRRERLRQLTVEEVAQVVGGAWEIHGACPDGRACSKTCL
jgi:hypothetical protein